MLQQKNLMSRSQALQVPKHSRPRCSDSTAECRGGRSRDAWSAEAVPGVGMIVRVGRIPIADPSRNDVAGAMGTDGGGAVRDAGAFPGVAIVIVGSGISVVGA